MGQAVVKTKLTPKQERFCQEYMIDGNATRAAKVAGYKANAAQQTGSENLCKPLIISRIAELGKETSKKLMIDREYVLKVILDVINDEEATNVEKLKASDMLAKYTGLYEVDNSQQTTLVNSVTVKLVSS